MINIRQQVYDALRTGCPGADVSDEMPKDWACIPKVTFTEERNETRIWTDNGEKDAVIGYRVDCWDRDCVSVLMCQADDAMTRLGFRRMAAYMVPARELYQHAQLRYEAFFSVDSDYVFHI